MNCSRPWGCAGCFRARVQSTGRPQEDAGTEADSSNAQSFSVSWRIDVFAMAMLETQERS